MTIPRGKTDQAVQVHPMQIAVARLTAFFGGHSQLAELLGVARSQPGRWLRRMELPAAASRRAIQDLDYVVGRLEEVWERDVARVWLVSENAFLDGGRPIEVLHREGPGRVIAAIDAVVGGSYA